MRLCVCSGKIYEPTYLLMLSERNSPEPHPKISFRQLHRVNMTNRGLICSGAMSMSKWFANLTNSVVDDADQINKTQIGGSQKSLEMT